MRVRISISLLLLLISLNSYSQSDTSRVLFLGNSYTGVNNLPSITQSLATGANKTLIIDSNTPGGHTLEGHSTNTTSLNKIMQGNWDFVVLQEQSQFPTIDYYRYNSMYPGAERLNDTIKKYNSCAKVIMYMTWGRRFGGQQCDPTGTNCSPIFVDFSHMQDSLESAYVEIAENIDAYISPVGIAWKKVIEDTTIVLHSGDNSHPNYNGSYLAACVFHSIIWDESPIGLTYTGLLSNAIATYLQNVADSTVFDASSNWNLDIDNVSANFSFNTFGDSVQFTNLSQSLLPATYLWDFGDGNTSNFENPSHTYTSNQTYTVSLIVEHCSKIDTVNQSVAIINLGVEHINLKSLINVFPNPVFSNLEIEINKKNLNLNVQIFDYSGKLMESYHVHGKQHINLNVEFLPSGLYLLILNDNKNYKQATFKVVKK